jgi:hypothetical protein
MVFSGWLRGREWRVTDQSPSPSGRQASGAESLHVAAAVVRRRRATIGPGRERPLEAINVSYAGCDDLAVSRCCTERNCSAPSANVPRYDGTRRLATPGSAPGRFEGRRWRIYGVGLSSRPIQHRPSASAVASFLEPSIRNDRALWDRMVKEASRTTGRPALGPVPGPMQLKCGLASSAQRADGARPGFRMLMSAGLVDIAGVRARDGGHDG